MASCVVVDGSGVVVGVSPFDPAQVCTFVALEGSEASELLALVDSGALAPMDPATFSQVVAGVAGLLVVAFLASYFVGLVLRQVE